MLQLTYDLGTYLNLVFFALSIADVKKGGFHFKKQIWPSKSHEGQLQSQNEGHHWTLRWNLLQEWPSLFWKIFYLRKYQTVPGLFRHPVYNSFWLYYYSPVDKRFIIYHIVEQFPAHPFYIAECHIIILCIQCYRISFNVINYGSFTRFLENVSSFH